MAPGAIETAVDMAAAVRDRRVSPVELVQRSLERAQLWQEAINAFTQLYVEAASDAARELEARLAGGDHGGPLCGVPFAAKDLFDVEGRDTTGCSRAYEGNRAKRDAAVIVRMREA